MSYLQKPANETGVRHNAGAPPVCQPGSAQSSAEADRIYLQGRDTAPTFEITFHLEKRVFCSNKYLAGTKFTALQEVLGHSAHAVVVCEAVTY